MTISLADRTPLILIGGWAGEKNRDREHARGRRWQWRVSISMEIVIPG